MRYENAAKSDKLSKLLGSLIKDQPSLDKEFSKCISNFGMLIFKGKKNLNTIGLEAAYLLSISWEHNSQKLGKLCSKNKYFWRCKSIVCGQDNNLAKH